MYLNTLSIFSEWLILRNYHLNRIKNILIIFKQTLFSNAKNHIISLHN